MRARRLLVIGILLAAIAAAASDGTERWRVLYFYDQLDSSLVINDFKFLTAKNGVAAGFLIDKNGKIKPTTLTSDDGGQHWRLVPIKDVPLSLFFHGENRGWLVGDDSLWRSEDGGHT